MILLLLSELDNTLKSDLSSLRNLCFCSLETAGCQDFGVTYSKTLCHP